MIKRYFLYTLMGSSLCLFAMENSQSVKDKMNAEVQRIVQKINEDHLSANQDTYLLPLKSWYDFYDAVYLTDEQVESEMDMIASYVQWEFDKESVLQELIKEHWYVEHLMKRLVAKKIDNFNKATGSTIDALFNSADDSDLKKIVHECVKKHFSHEFSINTPLLDDIPMESLGIHFTVLDGSNQIKLSSLEMTTDGKYVRATKYDKAHITWDTRSGNTVDLLRESQNIQNINWIPAEKSGDFGGWYPEGKMYSVATTENYHATAKKTSMIKAITLIKRPELISHLYQKALDNSKGNLQELKALKNSKKMSAIEGFPQQNIKTEIAKRIAKLESAK